LVDSSLRDAVASELELVLRRPPLANSPRLSRLLRFLVEETLAQRGAGLNEHNIGTRVFDRGRDFNPRTDPIVRVQTHHLRARLVRYYLTDGAADPVAIELPCRTYVPRFRPVALPAPVVAPQIPAAAPAPPARHAGGDWAGYASILALVAVAFGLTVHAWRTPARHDPDPAAQALYARGRYLLDRQTESALRQAADCFRESAARDRKFAAPYAGLADAYNLLVQYGFLAPNEGMEAARKAARHALEIDPRLAEAYVALAAVSEAYDWNFPQAESQYRRAIELNPQLPAAHLWYGMFLRDQGRLAEALPELRRAEELEPLSVLAAINLAYADRRAGNSDAALELARTAEESDAASPLPKLLLADLYASRADRPGADAALAEARSLSAGDAHALSALACAYARLGRRADSADVFEQLRQLAAERYVSPFDLGSAALTLGDEDRALGWFEEAYRERSSGIVFLRHDRDAAVQHSARLQALLRRIGNG
jgi:tetratricopeptide (TPR) repeat protein